MLRYIMFCTCRDVLRWSPTSGRPKQIKNVTTFQTKTLRKSSREETSKSSTSDLSTTTKASNGVVVPRNSMTLFSERTNLNKMESPSRSSISSSTRSLHKPEAAKNSPGMSRRTTTSNYGNNRFDGNCSMGNVCQSWSRLLKWGRWIQCDQIKIAKCL